MANRGKSVKGTRYSRAGWAALNTLGAKVVKMFWEDLDLVIPRWRWWLSTDPGNNQTMNNGSRKFSANVLEEEFLPLPTWHAGPACRHRTSSQSRVRALAWQYHPTLAWKNGHWCERRGTPVCQEVIDGEHFLPWIHQLLLLRISWPQFPLDSLLGV